MASLLLDERTLASRDGNEEKDEHTLVRTTWVVSFDGDAHCLSMLKIEVIRQRVNAETCRDIAIHGWGVRREDGGEQRKDGCGDSWLRRGLYWQNGMGHHDRLVADNRTK